MNVIELGAGIGLCGLVCRALGFKKVILTDLPIAIELLERNISLNTSLDANSICAQVLEWGNTEHLTNIVNQFNASDNIVVIAADCVYWEILFQPLLETIKTFVLQYNLHVIIAHVKRWKKDEKFFKLCRKFMTVELLDETREMVPHEHTGIPTREIKRIYRISKPLS